MKNVTCGRSRRRVSIIRLSDRRGTTGKARGRRRSGRRWRRRRRLSAADDVWMYSVSVLNGRSHRTRGICPHTQRSRLRFGRGGHSLLLVVFFVLELVLLIVVIRWLAVIAVIDWIVVFSHERRPLAGVGRGLLANGGWQVCCLRVLSVIEG